MSQYGYGYGPPQGYQPTQPYPYQPQQYHNLPSYSSTEATNSGSNYPAAVAQAQESYEYNRNAIPGLGLGLPSSHASWPQTWTNPSGQQSEPLQLSSTDHVPVEAGDTTQDSHPAEDNTISVGHHEDAMEEGELSEGELEDIYEPQEDENAPVDQQPLEEYSISSASKGLPVTHHSTARLNGQEAEASSAYLGESSNAVRERSGSYSPYLSPREMRYSSPSNAAHESDDISQSDPNRFPGSNASLSQGEEGSSAQEKQHTSTSHFISADQAVAESKTKAQQAILRLWPLSVGYQSFLNEGVDKSILDELFTELGLIPQSVIQEPAKAIHSQMESNTSKARDSPQTEHQVHQTSTIDAGPGKEAKDKSEERKDRIARLLAAKGSKATATAPETSAVSTVNAVKLPLPATTTIPSSKSQSEKSKLLQQKMEALKKSREEKAKRAAQKEELSVSNTSNLVPVGTSLHDSLPMNREHNSGVPTPLDELLQPQAQLDQVESLVPQSIPGLFLSSTPQPSQPTNLRKRPVAADLNETSATNPYKRPFGQLRESRPFLIDVSDDEDDAEMEIDSPEQRSPVLQRPITPLPKTTSFRDHPALSDNGLSRQVSSPSAAATPTGPAASTNSLYDLESMNRKIEDMKRRIAEAEARKKAKQSNNGTPSVPPSQQESKEGSADPVFNARPVLTRAETEDNRLSASVPVQTTSQTHQQRLPKVRGERQQAINSRIRSRIASERLPVVEARRKEQLARLYQLQAEVAKVEQDIEASIAEEKKLRQEVEDTSTGSEDSEHSDGPVLAAPLAARTESTEGQKSAAKSQSEIPPNEDPATTPATAAVGKDSFADEESQDDPMDLAASPEQPDAQNNPEEGDTGPSQEEQSTPPDEPNGVALAPQNREKQDEEVDEHAVEPLNQGNDSVASPLPATEPNLLSQVEGLPSPDAQDPDSDTDDDVAMEEVDDSSSDEDASGSSDEYEPAEAVESSPSQASEEQISPKAIPVDEDAVLETPDTDVQGVATTSPITEPISTAEEDSVPGPREVEGVREPSLSAGSKSTFVPYETPLQYFRAYRFHPNFKDNVSGGLRSLTYSNMLDIKREVCPDQLAGDECPRGNACEFQHLDKIKAPDDQILLQLGAYGNYEGEQKQRYINGLRELLTEFRNRDIKDFQTISQSIIEYRVQFHGDKTKILPLGNVSI